jgi:hypothetical protein
LLTHQQPLIFGVASQAAIDKIGRLRKGLAVDLLGLSNVRTSGGTFSVFAGSSTMADVMTFFLRLSVLAQPKM